MRFALITALSLGLCGLAGCNYFQPAPTSSTPYPTTPPNASGQTSTTMSAVPAAPTTAAVIKVPADAIQLRSGDYPPPAFTVPNQSGTILVVDLDGDPTIAVASTTVSANDAGKQMSITDVTNMSNSINKLHKYRIVFVPK